MLFTRICVHAVYMYVYLLLHVIHMYVCLVLLLTCFSVSALYTISRYEDLKNNTYSEMRKMLDFLNIEYTPDQLAENLANDFVIFKR